MQIIVRSWDEWVFRSDLGRAPGKDLVIRLTVHRGTSCLATTFHLLANCLVTLIIVVYLKKNKFAVSWLMLFLGPTELFQCTLKRETSTWHISGSKFLTTRFWVSHQSISSLLCWCNKLTLCLTFDSILQTCFWEKNGVGEIKQNPYQWENMGTYGSCILSCGRSLLSCCFPASQHHLAESWRMKPERLILSHRPWELLTCWERMF